MTNDKFAWYAGWSMIAIAVVGAVFLPLAAGCSGGATPGVSDNVLRTDYVIIEVLDVKGHEYVLAGPRHTSGGCAMVHSASCPCQEDE
jgi:hypothetical protein